MRTISLPLFLLVLASFSYGQISPPVEWAFVSSTGGNATAAIPSSINPIVGNRLIQTGDAIGVFFNRNDSLVCAGYVIWVNGRNAAITIWGDNDQTTMQDGFASGEVIKFKVWDAIVGIEYPAVVSYQVGDGIYIRDGIYQLSSLRTLLSAPTLIQPANNSILQRLNPFLKWHTEILALTYRLQVATDINFQNTVLNDSTIADTVKQIGPLKNSTLYYWRVNAKNVGSTSSFSEVRSFLTTPVPQTNLTSLFFPDTRVGDSSKIRLVLRNPMPFDLRLDSLRWSILSFSAYVSLPMVIGGNDSLALDFSFKPSVFSSLRDTLRVFTSDGTLRLPMAGTSPTPIISLERTLISFGNVVKNVTSTQVVKVRNSSVNTLTLDSVYTRTAQFSVTPVSGSVKFSDSLGINVSFTPDDTKDFVDTLYLKNNSLSPIVKISLIGASPILVPLFPSNNSINQPTSLALSWSSYVNVITYHLQLAFDSTFSSGLVVNDSLLTSPSRTVSGLLNDTLYYWRIAARSNNGKGPFSTVWRFRTVVAIPATPILSGPGDRSVANLTTLTLSWNASARAARYRLQLALDSLFASVVVEDSTLISPSRQISSLSNSTQYYWRVKAVNLGGESPYCGCWRFLTGIPAPSNVVATPMNKRISVTWSGGGSSIARYKVYRSLSSPATSYLDTTSMTSYVDTTVINGTKYYYRITAVHQTLVESPFSSEVSAQPYNQLPHPATLNDVNQYSTGRVVTSRLTFSSAGSQDPDGSIDSIYWYINDKFMGQQAIVTSDFGPGTNKVTLVVRDNDGQKDSSVAYVNRAMFRKQFSGPVYAGLSMMGDKNLYAIASGDAVYRMDGEGNVLYTVQAGGDIRSSSSMAYDTTVYLASSDKNLYAFSKNGNSLWPALSLGGELSATAAVDSASNRLYIGVSNRNFIAINRVTGLVAWSILADAPIRNSAVITLERKLVFATEKGTVYGVDLSNLPSPLAPTWQLELADTVTSSPAIDDQGYIYLGTKSGKVVKLSLPKGQEAIMVWQMQTGGSIVGSPVIDGNGTLYVGSEDAKLYAVNRQSGAVKWVFQSAKGIRSTPAISNSGNIYFGNDAGEFYMVDSNATVKWYYKDSASITAPVLYQQGVAYIGTEGNTVLAFYDNADSAARGVTERALGKPPVRYMPMWGTYQGNNQRTGLALGTPLTAVEKVAVQLPTAFRLEQNYPNPFNPATTIKYAIPALSHVKLGIYNILGQKIEELMDGEQEAGYYEITWSAAVSTGIYLYRLEARTTGSEKSAFVQTKRMLLIR